MNGAACSRLDARMLALAARHARRAAGLVEPNPLVGCVVGTSAGDILAVGHHRVFGGAHAEVEALRACRDAGRDTRGATMWVTLEPCSHTGKTPPCTDAILDAGVARVIIAHPDPTELARGGADVLRAAGVEAVFVTDPPPAALRVSAPFIKRATSGMPWVIAKWAQTLDGRIADRSGASQWISSAPSRRFVHRLRARMDAVLTGIGTVRSDDPRLTARGRVRVRRRARRVVVDPRLETPDSSALVGTLADAPLTLACLEGASLGERADSLRRRGVEVRPLPDTSVGLDLAALLRELRQRHDATNVLVEAGAGLVGALLDADLVDELLVFVAPRMLRDTRAMPPALGKHAALADADRFSLRAARRCGDDAMLVLRRG